MGVTLNHPNFHGMFPKKDQPANLGYPHDYGDPHKTHSPRNHGFSWGISTLRPPQILGAQSAGSAHWGGGAHQNQRGGGDRCCEIQVNRGKSLTFGGVLK